LSPLADFLLIFRQLTRFRATPVEVRATGEATRGMDVKIKLSIAFSVSESSLEDALAEYDEITVQGLMREVIDKAIACEEVSVHVDEGPNTLEELDALKS
jgi:hypothetical protein